MGHQHNPKDLGQAYNVSVVGRNVAVTDAMKAYALEKIHKIDRYSPRTVDVSVAMDITRAYQRVDIVMRFDHLLVKVHETTSDMYASIDLAVKKLIRRLERYHERINDHDHMKARSLESVDLEEMVYRGPMTDEDVVDEINEQIVAENARRADKAAQPPHLVKGEKWPLKTLNLTEAVMQIDVSGDPFLLFRSEEDRKVKCLYWRPDGHLGLRHVEA